jgi:hypothetical protein
MFARAATMGLLLALFVTMGGPSGSLLAGQIKKATTSKDAKAAAIQSIPFERLSKADRTRVSKILSSRNIYRRLPVHVSQCDPQFYDFCLKNPDLVINIWRAFGITDIEIQKQAQNQYAGKDKEGTKGTVEFLYRDYETTLILIEGQYNGPLTAKPVAGRVLMVLRTGFVRNTDGKYYATSQLDTFTQIDNVAIDFFTRTLQPLLGHTADNNFVQTSAFIGSLSRTAETNPEGVKRLREELKGMDKTTLDAFDKVIDGVAARAVRQASYEAKVQARQRRR